MKWVFDVEHLTKDKLDEVLSYDKATGDFYWKVALRYGCIGKLAGTIKPNGYRSIRIGLKAYYAHRLVWLHETGEFPTQQIDHINRNKLDNRFINLRDVSSLLNNQNVDYKNRRYRNIYGKQNPNYKHGRYIK